MKKLSIIIPVYCNSGSLHSLFEKLCFVESELKLMNVCLELIFVDDGSTDDSIDILKKLKEERKETVIIKLTRNFGAISAVKTGLNYVTGDCFAFLAADLQDPPELLIKMVQSWEAGNKYIICERQQRDDPIVSKLYASLYYKLLRAFVAKDYPSKGFDLALMDRDFLEHLKICGKHVNFPLFPFWLGYKPVILHYKRRKREHGSSKWSFRKRWKLLIDSIFSFSFAPVRLISMIGLMVSISSFLYGAVVVISAISGKIDVPGFATITALMSFLLGLIIVMLGVISEYVWRIFDEVNKHPYAVIEKEI